MSKSGEVKELKGNKAYDSAFIAMIVLSMGASSLLVHQFSTPEGGNAATKPYNTFEEFYPHYISEHSDQTCRRLHFVGTSLVAISLIFEPSILFAGALAASVGYSVFSATKHLDNGLIEMIFMIGTFIAFMRKLTGTWWKGLAVPIVAYTFAWVGHFYFELNRPATFIYPAFSLAGDLRMFSEILGQQRPF